MVTMHYYSIMSTVIDEYFNGSFHFAPPRHRRQSLANALKELHERIGCCLKLTEGITKIYLSSFTRILNNDSSSRS